MSIWSCPPNNALYLGNDVRKNGHWTDDMELLCHNLRNATGQLMTTLLLFLGR